MDRIQVASSNIRSIGYDKNSSTLEIEFIKSGLYKYSNVPQIVYDQFLAASSKGRFFDARIKNQYRAIKFR